VRQLQGGRDARRLVRHPRRRRASGFQGLCLRKGGRSLPGMKVAATHDEGWSSCET
jgi:hypothetical protein